MAETEQGGAMSRSIPWVLVLALFWSEAARAAEPAELVVRGANILTQADRPARATALAIAGGKFVAVGTDAEVATWIGPKTQVLDLKGRTIVPGFIDAHAHPRPLFELASRWYVVECGPERVKTLDDLVAALARKAKVTPAGSAITGFGYQETKLGRHPTRQDLDRASTEHPIVISHSSGHLSVCNSLALKLAGIDKDTKDPPGGQFERDRAGEPTGLLKERAAGIVRAALPKADGPSPDELLAGYRACFREFLRRGIITVHVAGTDPSTARLLTRARTQAEPLRLYVMLREGSLDQAVELKKAMADDEAGVRYGAIKLFHGNSLSGQTCWLSKAYADRPDYFGVPPARSQIALNALIARVHNAGLQACVHSNGDREITMVLDAFEAALTEKPREDHRHRIEHCSVVTEAILARIKKLNLVIAPHSYIYEHGDKMEAYGAERWDWMHPNRSLLDLGVPIAGNSDYPVSAAVPLLRIQDMVTRTSAEGKVYGPKQRTTAEQALRAWTRAGAYAGFDEKSRGAIAVGLLADFVVLAADPTAVEAKAIKDIEIEATYVGGRPVYERK
jgi:predicted amidohydrolase YtcJ